MRITSRPNTLSNPDIMADITTNISCKKHKTAELQERRHLNDLSIYLILCEFTLIFDSSVLVCPGEAPKLCNQQHGIGCYVHSVPTKVVDHPIDVLEAHVCN